MDAEDTFNVLLLHFNKQAKCHFPKTLDFRNANALGNINVGNKKYVCMVVGVELNICRSYATKPFVQLS